MRYVTLPDGEQVPCLGIGTWRMGENGRKRRGEIEAVRTAIELGLTLIDTAEMYGEGGAEEVVAEAVADRRRDVFIVTKVHPRNASGANTIAACERSLKRLRSDVIDLYLLHWRSSVPLEETVGAFRQLQKDGKIRHWGVSNFDVGDMAELMQIDGGCAANQVMYHLGARGIEFDLLASLKEAGVPMMAYSPLAAGDILENKTVNEIAESRSVSPATVALAWVLRQEQVMAIPKTSKKARVKEFRDALDLTLNVYELQGLDKAFPVPEKRTPLAMS
ncbi:MAG TPA: aldo/keto reductase [Aestuariivirgaceae bacterium]|jgi:diketogulonate reductase-like aldo/keto reductase|nr:aldo/keto reductase [Aestuariivirgaceae bacterium]